MKRFLFAAAVAAVAFSPIQAMASETAPSNLPRLQHQRDRIAAGVADGSLTRREAHRLGHREARIHRQALRARADGEISGRERVRLHNSLDRESRAIYRERHDRQHRP